MTTELSPRLAAHLSALDATPPETATDMAQKKLEARLSNTRPATVVRRPWFGWAAVAATGCMVLALVMLPTSPGMAFAAVQKHLRDFTTLSLTIEQRSQGIAMPTIHVRMKRDGDARMDTGASSTIVNLGEHRILTLLHDSHMAMQSSLPTAASSTPVSNLAWLEPIRRFQGKATRLPDKRTIDGRLTTGWALDTGGMHIKLWADSDDLPRAIEINGGQMLSQTIHVAVDRPMDASVFSTRIPAGYQLMQPEEDQPDH